MDLLDLMQAPAARYSDPVTSHQAAQKAEMRASEYRLMVLLQLLAGPKTDFDLAAATGKKQCSIGKRRGECRDAGLVRELRDGRGELVKGKSDIGSPVLTWEITQAGREYLAEHGPERV